MTLNERQQQELSTCMHSCRNLAYPTLGLIEEVSELLQKVTRHIQYNAALDHTDRVRIRQHIDNVISAGIYIGKIAKSQRHGNLPLPFSPLPSLCDSETEIRKEIGDVKWMIDAIDFYLTHPEGTDPATVPIEKFTSLLTARLNYAKLKQRQANHQIDGRGDNERHSVE